MENLKVKVENEAESKEVQELFFELGCFIDYPKKCLNDAVILFLESCGLLTYSSTETYVTNGVEYKEITLPQLRDMVVLKRNDKSDATHASGNYQYYLTNSEFFEYRFGKWINVDEEVGGVVFKPIKGKEMKEFLVNHDNKWTLQLLDADTEENSYRVAVPSGATHCAKGKYSSNRVFFKVDSTGEYEHYNDVWLFRKNPLNRMYFTENLLWQRSETKSLNDTYVEIEKVRQEIEKVTIDELKHRVYKKDVSHLDFIDVYRVLELFNVQSHAVGHAIKKLLCSGGRGAKDEAQDIQEAIDSLIRYQEMKNEDG